MLAGAASAVAAEPPRIDRLEFFLTNQITVHFDTDKNRRYELQFRDVGAGGTAGWANLFVADPLPFPNH